MNWPWSKREEVIAENVYNAPTAAEQKEMQDLGKEFNKADLGIKQAACQNTNATAMSTYYMVPMAEIRMALSQGQFKDGDTGLGERHHIEPMFEENDRKRLQKRYFTILDAYLIKVLQIDATKD